MVSYLPVGCEEATKWYVEQALRAGVGFINAIPVFIGREPYWQRRFAEEGLPVIGDDIKSQVGATITHRVLTRLFMDRGVRLDRTYQLNFGGNTDFLNMLERERLESKKISKTNAVTSMLDYELDRRRRPRRPLATTCRGSRTASGATSGWRARPSATCRSTRSSSSRSGTRPNSAGVITDAIRCLKLGLDRGLSGTLVAPSSYFMKSPPQQIHDDIAFNRVEAFIRGEDNETLVGTEAPKARKLRKMASGHRSVADAVSTGAHRRAQPGKAAVAADVVGAGGARRRDAARRAGSARTRVLRSAVRRTRRSAPRRRTFAPAPNALASHPRARRPRRPRSRTSRGSCSCSRPSSSARSATGADPSWQPASGATSAASARGSSRNDRATPRVRRAATDPGRARTPGSLGVPPPRPHLPRTAARAVADRRRSSSAGSRSSTNRSSATRSAPATAIILVGLHLASVELVGFVAARWTGHDHRADGDARRRRAPGVDRPDARARSGSGSSGCARRGASCSRPCERGETVGIVADRDLTRRRHARRAVRCARTAPDRTCAAGCRDRTPIYVGAIRRSGRARTSGELVRARRSRATGTRRDRVLAAPPRGGACVRTAHRARARTSGGASSSRSGPTSRRPPPRRPTARRTQAPHDATGSAAPTCTSTPSRPTGPRACSRSSTTCERSTPLDVIAITDHERVDAAHRRAGDRPGPRPAVRGDRRRGGDDPRRAPAGAVHRAADQAAAVPARDDRPRPRPGRHRDPGPSARALPALRPGRRAAPARRRRRSALPPRRPRGVQPDGARPPAAPPDDRARDRARPRDGRQQRRPLARGDRPGLVDVPGPDRGGPAAGDPRAPHPLARQLPRHPRCSSRSSAASCASTAAAGARRSAARSFATARAATSATRAAGSGPAVFDREAARGLRRPSPVGEPEPGPEA